jgi:hypothetical protein
MGAPKQRFPSYRQWKAWRGLMPLEHLRLCFICQRPLAVFDGLATSRVIGGKAAAFGGNGRERMGWNKPVDKIRAGCTVKLREVVERKVTPAHTITAYGREWNVPEVIEQVFQDRLMPVSVSGIGCELCRTLAEMAERGYVDVSNMVLMMDPDDAPAQDSNGKPIGTAARRQLRGPVTLSADNILRVKERVVEEPFVDRAKVQELSAPKPAVEPIPGAHQVRPGYLRVNVGRLYTEVGEFLK